MGEIYGIVWREKESWWKNEDIEKVVKDKKVAQKKWKESQLQEDKVFVRVVWRQESTLSPSFFNIAIDVMAEEVREAVPWSMLFADDITLCAESREDLSAHKLEAWELQVKSLKT